MSQSQTTTKIENKNNIITVIFGEIARSYYGNNNAKQENPILLVDSRSFDEIKYQKNNYSFCEISENGTGANPEVGSQLVVQNQSQLLDLVKNYDIVNIITTMGGGTGAGAGTQFAKIVKTETKKIVLVNILDLLPHEQSGNGNRQENANFAIKNLVDCNYSIISTDNLQDNYIEDVNNRILERIANILELLDIDSLDYNDVSSLFNNSEFILDKITTKTNPELIAEFAEKTRLLTGNITNYNLNYSSNRPSSLSISMITKKLEQKTQKNSKSKVTTTVTEKKEENTILFLISK